MLSVKAHIAATAVVLFGTFGRGIVLGKYLLAHGWGRISVILSALLLVGGVIFLFDRFVPAKCPRCGGRMYGDGSAYRWGKSAGGAATSILSEKYSHVQKSLTTG
jgi:hypothetical protein